jgi:hypothetical protein
MIPAFLNDKPLMAQIYKSSQEINCIDFHKNNLTASSVGDMAVVFSPTCFPSESSGKACEINFLKIYGMK